MLCTVIDATWKLSAQPSSLNWLFLHFVLANNSNQVYCWTCKNLIFFFSAFLDEFLRKYGSLIPLTERDVLMKLEQIFHQDFRDR